MELNSGYGENTSNDSDDERRVHGSSTEPSTDSYFSNVPGSPVVDHVSNSYNEDFRAPVIYRQDVLEDDDDLNYSMYLPEQTRESRLLESRDDSAPSPSVVAKQSSSEAVEKGGEARSNTGLPIDWNDEFQRLLELPEATVMQRLDKNHRISALSKNFVDLAKRWGKVIIEEHFLPPQYRTISPIDIGGQAGGVKYIYNGILFKLQTDWKNIYSSHFLAMKTGGLELKGLMRYYGCEGLHVPLMAVIDYRGFRLVAMSILPIEKKKTLIYGSCDAGKTVMATDGYFNKMMANAAQKLNIKGHYCGKDKDALKFLHGPTDIEGHLGLTDKRYYVLDFARIYPPTAEDGVKRTFLYKVFRPEFISRYRIPLSSDAFSPFSVNDPNKKADEREVLEATQHLLSVTIPAFAQWLDEHYKSASLEERLDSFTEMVHREGINVRYIGLIRAFVKDDYLKRFILMEMVARVVKHKVRSALREAMQSQRTLASDAFTGVILDNFNQMLGYHEKSPQFWKSVAVKLDYFRGGVTADEKKSSFELSSALDMRMLFNRVQEMLGVKLSYHSRKEFDENPNEFKLVIADITAFVVKVKKMNTISLAEGNALAIQAILELQSPGSRHHDRLFRLAMTKFDSAILATPDNSSTLRQYASILTEFALLKAKAGESALELLEKAFDKYTVARDLPGLLELGQNVLRASLIWSERDKSLDLADKCFLEVLRVDGINVEACTQRGELFLMKARRSQNPSYYEEAGAMFRKSIELVPGGEFGWLAEWFSSLSDNNLGMLIDIMTDSDKTVFDASKCIKPALVADELVISTVKNVSNLRRIRLRNCVTLTDDALVAIAKSATAIVELDLNGCAEIKDNGVGHVASSCTALTHLSIAECPKLSNFSFDSIVKNLKKIQFIDCSYCKFDGRHLNAFESLSSPALKTLKFSNVYLMPDIWTKAFGSVKFEALSDVDLTEATNLTDGCLSTLVKLSGANIERLILNSSPRVTSEGIVAVANNCHKLKHLGLTSCMSINGKALDILATLNSNMETILLDNCVKIFDPDRRGWDRFIEANTRLKRISMVGTPLDDDLMSAFAFTKNLEEINFSGTQMGSLGFNIIAKQNSNLRSVNISQLANILDDSIVLLAKAAGDNLQNLNISGCRRVGPALGKIGIYCSKLLTVDFSHTLVDGECLEKLTKASHEITELSLVDCRDVTDSCVAPIARLHNLKKLDISKCILLSNIALISTGCPLLEFLSVEKCEHIESSSIVSLSFLPLLKDLNVVGVHGADDNMLVTFKDKSLWKSLEMLHIGSGNKFSNEQLEKYLPERPQLSVNLLMKSGQVPSPMQAGKKLHIVLNKSTASLPTSTPGSPPQSSRNDVAATRRLMQDLKQLQKFPVPSIAASPVNDNMFLWHCNLRAPEGSPYQGALFHIELKFPADYPSSPPKATMFTPCPHPHVKDGRICLDILSDFSSFFSDDVEGWTSAYSVQTILLQVQTFLMDLTPNEKDTTPIGEYLKRIPAAVAAANSFSCAACGHGPDHIWPELMSQVKSLSPPPNRGELDIIQDELKCYHTQLTYKEDILGIGITIERYKNGDLKEISSPFELLSKSAFFEQNVRTSVYATDENGAKVTFQEWLPLYITKEHFDRAFSHIGQALIRICNRKSFSPDLGLLVFPKMMNKMVISLMKGKLHGSVKALEGYIAFHRLFILFCEKYPDLLKKINETVADFIQNESMRSKKTVPDLGEFIALLSVSNYSWEDVSTAYLSENFTRNVRWVIQKYPELNTFTPNSELDKNRLSKTYLASSTSMQLMLYNVYFLEHIGRPKGKSLKEVADGYDATFGYATNAMKEHFMQCINEVRNVKDYSQVFKRIGVAVPTESELCAWMRASVKKSLELNYHTLDGGNLKTTNSAPGSPYIGSGGGLSRSNSNQRGTFSARGGGGFSARGGLSSSGAAAKPEAEKPVCRDWQTTGTCPREKCRFAHPPLRGRK